MSKTRTPTDDETGQPNDEVTGGRCPDCTRHYTNVAHHIRQSDCSHSMFDDEELELIEGVLLAGGMLTYHSECDRPYLSIVSGRRPFLDWVDENLQSVSTNICPTRFDESGDPTYWRLDTGVHPTFEEFHDRWYDESGNQSVPASISRSPTMLRAVFAKYGEFDGAGSFRRYYLRVADIPAPPRFFQAYFGDYGVSEYYDTNRGPNTSDEETLRRVYIHDFERLVDEIGEPITGMEDLWPSENTILVNEPVASS